MRPIRKTDAAMLVQTDADRLLSYRRPTCSYEADAKPTQTDLAGMAASAASAAAAGGGIPDFSRCVDLKDGRVHC